MENEELVKHKRHIAFDLDGTLLTEVDWPNFGKNIEKNLEFLRKLHVMGVPIAIYTARIYDDKDMREKTKNELEKRNIPYNELSSSKKPYYVCFVDDRAVQIKSGEEFSEENKNDIMKVIKQYDMTKEIESSLGKSIDELLDKDLSEEDIMRIMDRIKNGTLNINVLKLAWPEVNTQKSDLLDKLKNGEKNVV